MQALKKLKNSLVVRATALMVTLVLLLLVALVLGNTYLYRASAQAAIESVGASVALYEKQMSGQLDEVATGLRELAASIIEDNLGNSGEDWQQYLGGIQLGKLLNQKLAGDTVAKSYFFINQQTGYSVFRFRSMMSADEKFLLQDYVREGQIAQSGAFVQQWNLVALGQRQYFMQAYRIGAGYLGCAVQLDDLLNELDTALAPGTTQYIFSDGEGRVLLARSAGYLAQNQVLPLQNGTALPAQEQYFFSSRALPSTELTFSAVKRHNDVYSSVWLTQLLLVALGVLTVCFALVNAWYLYRQVLKPIQIMVEANRRLEQGDMSYQITEPTTSTEFTTLKTSFNKMVAEIGNLKIRSYEEKLARQKEELNYLKAQIRPHFFLNAVTTISSLAYQQKNGDIQTFVQSLSAYLRYMITDPFGEATVERELAAACDYIGMQRIRYPGRVFFMVELEEGAKKVPIPKFVIQTFVENIFKHAFDPDKMLSVFVRGELTQQQSVRITIEDNGKGFSAEVLNSQNDEPVVTGGHIGINNIRRTLFLQYGRRDLVRLSNGDPEGACVILEIPCQAQEENKDENIDH